MAGLKALLKEFLQSPAFAESVELAALREPAAQELQEQIGAFVREEAPLSQALAAVAQAVRARVVVRGRQRPLWGFGGEGTARFAEALGEVGEVRETEEVLRRALVGVDLAEPAEPLRAFAAHVLALSQREDARGRPELHVGYATCFLTFCWHILYHQESPVFYGTSHRAIKELIAAGVLEAPGYFARELDERLRAFFEVTGRIRELLRRVHPQLGYWTVEAFLEWFAARARGQAGGDSGLLSARLPTVGTGEALPVSEQPPAPAAAPAPAGPGGAAALGFGPVAAPQPAAARVERERETVQAPVFDPVTPLVQQLGLPESLLRRGWELLETRGRLLLSGPVAVGKTHLGLALARAFADPGCERCVVLHPGLRYGQWIERETGPGWLADFVQAAHARPGARFVLLLDELGAVEPAAALGALLALLEHRGTPVHLPLTGAAFALPANVYVIATADPDGSRLSRRQLWRRFPVLQLEPEPDLLRRWLEQHAPELDWLVPVWRRLNASIAQQLGPEHRVGHGVFLRTGLCERMVKQIWEHEIEPLLGLELDREALAPLRLAALRAEAAGASEHPEPAS
ncbi:MAG: hypothetical protein D6776_11000 [Planctomycetota bacterium]|nr:MAG: hypothetical protein D6776_11000 [Planctomycetota bacterium]